MDIKFPGKAQGLPCLDTVICPSQWGSCVGLWVSPTWVSPVSLPCGTQATWPNAKCQMPKENEYKRLQGWNCEAAFAPPCSFQLSIWGPRKQRMALSGTHPIQQAFRPCSVQLRVTSPGGLYFVSAQDIMKSLYLLSGPMAMPLDNLSGWSSPSSSLELPHPPKRASPWGTYFSFEGQDGKARRLAW